MDTYSLTEIAEDLLAQAKASHSGRAAKTVYGGHSHALRQTVIALAADQKLAEHESPDEATLQVLRGRVRLTAGTNAWEGRQRRRPAGDPVHPSRPGGARRRRGVADGARRT